MGVDTITMHSSKRHGLFVLGAAEAKVVCSGGGDGDGGGGGDGDGGGGSKVDYYT